MKHEEPIWDKYKVWDQIESELDKKKKKRLVWWYFMTGLFLAGIIIFAWIKLASKIPDSSELNEEYVSTESAVLETDLNIRNKLSEDISMAMDSTGILKKSLLDTIRENSILNNDFSIKNKVVKQSKSKSIAQSEKLGVFKIRNEANPSFGILDDAGLTQNFEISESAIQTKDSIENSGHTLSYISQKQILNTEDSLYIAYSIVAPIPKTGIKLLDYLEVILNEPAYFQERRLRPKFNSQDRYILSHVSGGWHKIYYSGDDAYRKSRTDSERPNFQWAMSVLGFQRIQGNIYAYAGMAFEQIYTVYDYETISDESNTVIVDDAFIFQLPDGSIYFDKGPATEIIRTKRKLVTNNTLSRIHLPAGLALLGKSGQWEYGIQLGFDFRVFHNLKGNLLFDGTHINDNSTINQINDPNTFDLRLNTQLRLGYQIGKRITVAASLAYLQDRIIIRPAEPYAAYRQYSLGIGIQYNLSK